MRSPLAPVLGNSLTPRARSLPTAGLLHTIMFNRALGMVTPVEVPSTKGLDLCWVDCNDPNVRHKFAERVREFETSIDQKATAPISRASGAGGSIGGGSGRVSGAGGAAGPQTTQQHTVTLQFFRSHTEQSFFGGGTTKRRTWEEWKLPFTIHNCGVASSADETAEGVQQRASLSRELRERMMRILEQVDAKKDHLPDIGKAGGAGGPPVGVTYEWDILLGDASTGKGTSEAGGWGGGNLLGNLLS